MCLGDPGVISCLGRAERCQLGLLGLAERFGNKTSALRGGVRTGEQDQGKGHVLQQADKAGKVPAAYAQLRGFKKMLRAGEPLNEGMWLQLGGTTGRFGNRATLEGTVPSILHHPAGKSVPRSNRALQECVPQGLLGTGSSACTAANGPRSCGWSKRTFLFSCFAAGCT